jgi:hypothetical protein
MTDLLVAYQPNVVRPDAYWDTVAVHCSPQSGVTIPDAFAHVLPVVVRWRPGSRPQAFQDSIDHRYA